MEGPCRGEVNVQTHLVAKLLQVINHLGLGRRVAAQQGQPSEQSAEGVPLSDTCQSIHTPSGGVNELQLSWATSST